jgi:hypothetical protein
MEPPYSGDQTLPLQDFFFRFKISVARKDLISIRVGLAFLVSRRTSQTVALDFLIAQAISF